MEPLGETDKWVYLLIKELDMKADVCPFVTSVSFGSSMFIYMSVSGQGLLLVSMTQQQCIVEVPHPQIVVVSLLCR
jgi:hypothetical protein